MAKGPRQMAEAPQRLRTRWPWLALLLLAAGGVAATWAWWHGAPPSGRPSQVRSRAAAAPVHTAIVETKSFPVVLNGLGTVQATNTVTVRSRVDGQIERVAFEEGEMIKEGDLVVQIDAARVNAALDQAVPSLGEDDAR